MRLTLALCDIEFVLQLIICLEPTTHKNIVANSTFERSWSVGQSAISPANMLVFFSAHVPRCDPQTILDEWLFALFFSERSVHHQTTVRINTTAQFLEKKRGRSSF